MSSKKLKACVSCGHLNHVSHSGCVMCGCGEFKKMLIEPYKIEDYVKDMERMNEMSKQVARDLLRAQFKETALLVLIEELANEFLCVSNDPANPGAFTGNEPYFCTKSEQLADKVNKVLGLVKR